MAKKIILLVMFVFLITVIAAVPPQASTSVGGLELRFPQVDSVKINEDITSHMHVFNTSTELPITVNDGVNCTIHLYNHTGNHILQQDMDWNDEEKEWELWIDGGNFSKIGEVNFLIWCNSTEQGGFVSGMVDVTGTGGKLTLPLMIFYSSLMFILLFLFVISILGFNSLPDQDPKDLDGKLMDISWMKYLRYPMGILSWGSLTMLFFLGWNVADSYIGSTLAAKTFEVLYRLNFYALMIAVPIMFAYVIVKVVQDVKFKNMIERGIM